MSDAKVTIGSELSCLISKCTRCVTRHGWCWKHYRNWLKHGDPEYVKPPKAVVKCAEPTCIRMIGPGHELGTAGYCRLHYQRLRKHGDLHYEKYRQIRGSVEDRFWPRVERTDTCWIWIGFKDPRGYGRLYI